MKASTVAAFLMLAMVCAEPPPSHSYLPPSPNGRNPGFTASTSNLPQVASARASPGHHGFDANAVHDGTSHGNAAHQKPFGSHGAQSGSFGARSNFGNSYEDGVDVDGRGRNGQHGHGFGRNSVQGYQGSEARFSDQHQHDGYDQNSAAFGRNSLDELSGEPANYNFGYMVTSDEEGTEFGHHEERQDAAAHGEYHVVLPDGRKQTVSYEADERGFKPKISYEESESNIRSAGYDNNAQSIAHGSGNYGREYDSLEDGNARAGGNKGY